MLWKQHSYLLCIIIDSRKSKQWRTPTCISLHKDFSDRNITKWTILLQVKKSAIRKLIPYIIVRRSMWNIHQNKWAKFIESSEFWSSAQNGWKIWITGTPLDHAHQLCHKENFTRFSMRITVSNIASLTNYKNLQKYWKEWKFKYNIEK